MPNVDSPSLSYVSGQISFDSYLVEYNDLIGEEFQEKGKMVYNYNSNRLSLSDDSLDNVACERPLKNLHCIVLDDLIAKLELGTQQDFVSNASKVSSTLSSDCIQGCKGQSSKVENFFMYL